MKGTSAVIAGCDAMNCRRVVTLLAALLCMASTAFAADDIAEKAKVCVACHGADGIPQLKTTPVIWGQNAGYMFLQLRDFQSGARKNDAGWQAHTSDEVAEIAARHFKYDEEYVKDTLASADGTPHETAPAKPFPARL